MSPYRNILVVCHGNICRSPVAGAMLQKALPDRQIRTAGLGALVGAGVDPAAAELATADDIDVSAHKAQQISSELIQWADLILVMSHNQRTHLGQTVASALGKTMLFGHWLPHPDGVAGGTEIPDPYKKSREVFEHVHKMMTEAVNGWVRALG